MPHFLLKKEGHWIVIRKERFWTEAKQWKEKQELTCNVILNLFQCPCYASTDRTCWLCSSNRKSGTGNKKCLSYKQNIFKFIFHTQSKLSQETISEIRKSGHNHNWSLIRMSPHKQLYTGAVIYENFSLQCLSHSSNRFDNGGFNESWSLMRVVARRVLTLTLYYVSVGILCHRGQGAPNSFGEIIFEKLETLQSMYELILTFLLPSNFTVFSGCYFLCYSL